LPREWTAMTVVTASLAVMMAAVSIQATAVWICRNRGAEEKAEPESELYDQTEWVSCVRRVECTYNAACGKESRLKS
jgi:hypothetical protein